MVISPFFFFSSTHNVGLSGAFGIEIGRPLKIHDIDAIVRKAVSGRRLALPPVGAHQFPLSPTSGTRTPAVPASSRAISRACALNRSGNDTVIALGPGVLRQRPFSDEVALSRRYGALAIPPRRTACSRDGHVASRRFSLFAGAVSRCSPRVARPRSDVAGSRSLLERKCALARGDRSQPVLNFGCQAFPPTANRTSAHAAQSICIEPTLRSQLSRFRLNADEPIKPCHSTLSLRQGVSACAIDTSMVATALLIAASDGRHMSVR